MTFIITCNTHGILPYEYDNSNHKTATLRELPNHMRLIQIPATVHGVANISTLQNNALINDCVYHYWANEPNIDQKNILDMVNEIRDKIIAVNEVSTKKIVFIRQKD